MKRILKEPLLNFLVLGALLLVTGCRAVQDTAQLPGKAVGTVTHLGKGQKPVDPVELQQQPMRFGDDFAGRMVLSTEQLRRGTNLLSAIELQTWKVRYSGNVLAIASGPNTLANLLDLIVLVTLTRNSIQDYWMPKVYGDSAQLMLDASRDAETRIWTIAAPVLKPKTAGRAQIHDSGLVPEKPGSKPGPYGPLRRICIATRRRR